MQTPILLHKNYTLNEEGYQLKLPLNLETIIDFPVEECLAGAKSRIGKQRVDMPWIETQFDEEFKQWIMDFPKNELPIVYELLDRYKGEKSIYVFHSRADIEDYLLKTFG